MYPRFSKRAMISPTSPRWTPSGLTAKKVRSWLVPGFPHTGSASQEVLLAEAKAAAVARTSPPAMMEDELEEAATAGAIV